jgi:hypothetical protein
MFESLIQAVDSGIGESLIQHGNQLPEVLPWLPLFHFVPTLTRAELRPSRRSREPDQTQRPLTLVGLIGHHQRALV